MKVMVVRSEDHTRIQNYRNEHNISDKNPEQLVPLETITIEVVSDRPLAPLVTSDRPLATPVTPKAIKRRGGQPEATLAAQRELEVDTDYESSKAGSRSNSGSTESTEADDSNRVVPVTSQLIDEERRRQRIGRNLSVGPWVDVDT